MASFNKVILIGNLTRDVDCRTTGNGTIIAELGLAVNRRWRDQSGRDQEEVCFVDVTVWGKSAENCAQYLQKGSQVMVEGRLKLDQWEDRNDGSKHSKLGVISESVVFLSRSESGGQEENQNNSGSRGGDRRGNGQQNGAPPRGNNGRQQPPPPLPGSDINEDDIPF